MKKVLEEITRDLSDNESIEQGFISKVKDKTNLKIIHWLLKAAVISMHSYERLKNAGSKSNASLIINNLIYDMHKSYGFDLENSKITIYCIAEILGYSEFQDAYKLTIFGGHEWRILEKNSEQMLLLREKIWKRRSYHGTEENITWEKCDLRQELNNEFFYSIPQKDRAKIIKTRVLNSNNPWFETLGGEGTEDYAFLLSLDEIIKYFGDSGIIKSKSFNKNNEEWFDDQYNSFRVAYDERKVACWWWLRSPGDKTNGMSLNAMCVHSNGSVGMHGNFIKSLGGVRPALIVNFVV